jgi:hypothetical protein
MVGENDSFSFPMKISFRLECFYALTDGGKRIELVDDRLRGIDILIFHSFF